MDLFTHVIIAYLISFGLTLGKSPVYIAAGSLAGGLPDSDILLMPLARRFPLLRHHGITHSILGVTIFAVGGAILGPMVVPGANAWLLLLFMEIGGLVHILLDGFTHFAVPPFAPFSNVELHLDADRAVNGVTLAMSLTSFFLLVYERNTVPLADWLITGWLLLVTYLGYLVLRGVARYIVGKEMKKEGYTAVIPTANPFHWLLVEEHEASGSWSTRFAQYTIGRGIRSPQKAIGVEAPPPATLPVTTANEAIQLSYRPAMQRSRWLASTYRYATVNSSANGFRVQWFSIEFTVFGRAPGIRVDLDARTGEMHLERSWFRLRDLSNPNLH